MDLGSTDMNIYIDSSKLKVWMKTINYFSMGRGDKKKSRILIINIFSLKYLGLIKVRN